MGTCTPPNVAIDQCHRTTRQSTLGHYRPIMTIDGSGLSMRPPWSVFHRCGRRPESGEITTSSLSWFLTTSRLCQSYLQNESIQITIIGRHEGFLLGRCEIAVVVVDTDCLTDPESCAFDVGFVAEWT